MTQRVPFLEPHEKVPQKLSGRQMEYVTEPIRITAGSLSRKQIWSSLTLLILITAVQIMINAIIQDRIAMTTTDVKF